MDFAVALQELKRNVIIWYIVDLISVIFSLKLYSAMWRDGA